MSPPPSFPTSWFPDLLCFHGSPERDDEELRAETPATRLDALRVAYGTQARWVGGHTHKPLLRTLDGWTLLNPGSVGLPFEQRGGRDVNLARAEYLLLDRAPGGWQPTFRAVPYDVREVQQGILTSGMPHAEWLAAQWGSA
ncbi:metallophosphoesterase family protein [Deinococcus aestuarii]|uniref:metallophosphoesterase family protein n=1 Tax=Deinococcus aestuarii TaxID=2774531 RepID=UPI002484A86E|nr:metallophosphoesterase family protein [Deinococcus aestuarii]